MKKVLLVLILLLLCLPSCAKSYDYFPFTKSADKVAPSADYEEIDDETYNKYLEKAKEFVKDRSFDFNRPYFTNYIENENVSVYDPGFVQELSDEDLERFSVFYAYTVDFIDTFEDATKNMSQREKELYTDKFYRIMNCETYSRAVLGQKDYANVLNHALIFVALDENDAYSCTRVKFRSKYDELWLFNVITNDEDNDAAELRFYDEKLNQRLMKARDAYETATAKEALKLLKDQD